MDCQKIFILAGYRNGLHSGMNDAVLEKECLELIANGDELSFRAMYDRYRNKIYGIAFKLSRSTVVAEEIVQNVFLKIWVNRATLIQINNFEGYLFIVTRNEVYSTLTHIARDHKALSEWGKRQPVVENDAENRIMDKVYRGMLQKAIEQLPGQQKKVYDLMKVRGLKREEVANILEVSPETVKTHLSLAMKNIRNYCLMRLQLLIGLLIGLFF